jgi:uncharacterized protein
VFGFVFGFVSKLKFVNRQSSIVNSDCDHSGDLMALLEEVTTAIAAAMKAREQVTLDALRMLKSALTMKGIEKGRDLDERESQQVVQTLVKQRRESIEQFTKAGRTELAEKEAAEIVVLERYLPPAVSPEDITAAVDQAVTETGAKTAKDIGMVMKAAMARLAGKNVDGKVVNEAVRKRLT